ncbi:DUF742 domain-containing protein [Actinokineospora sp. PR83]|uniref:DUF742 domain-containing protein n=1 Tax=Actinokineospora sp. PR83 TaxID=2884908 RepID=UPI0027E006BB|nr:DUF742 domain-containing protein [Actinokineospora sp. PR83]MCG8914869.1 DUF742 domain-containing protein [Actinokineospora sp. PR83]
MQNVQDAGGENGRRRLKRRTEVGRTGARFGPPGQWRLAASDDPTPDDDPAAAESEIGRVGARFGGSSRKRKRATPPQQPEATADPAAEPRDRTARSGDPRALDAQPGDRAAEPRASEAQGRDRAAEARATDRVAEPRAVDARARDRAVEPRADDTRARGRPGEPRGSDSWARDRAAEPGDLFDDTPTQRNRADLFDERTPTLHDSAGDLFDDGPPARPEPIDSSPADPRLPDDPSDWSDADWVSRPESHTLVRPYAWTRGRTHTRSDLAIEALISTVAPDLATSWEHRAVTDLCTTPRSVAEVSALMSLPLGVARVLISDLADSHAVTIHHRTGDAPDLAFMGRVLEGLRKL